MKNFQDKVAVITGGASGIGRALGDRCIREGMKVVLADIEEKALIHAEAEMRAAGGVCYRRSNRCFQCRVNRKAVSENA